MYADDPGGSGKRGLGDQFNEKAQLEPYEGNYFHRRTYAYAPRGRNHKEIFRGP